MKNKLLPFLLALFLSSGLMAQTGSRIGQHERLSSSWNPQSIPTATFSSESEGNRIIRDIIDVIGLKANFEIRAANVPNAAAVVYGGKRYVLYNPTFINNLVRTTGNRWAAVSVLAHEVGHHLNGHTLNGSGSQPAVELEADEFSGFVLRKMGASLTDAQAAMKILANQRASRTHPAQYDRLASIAKGWENANVQGGNRAIAKTTTTRPQAQTSRPATTARPTPATARVSTPALSSRNIIGQVSFHSDRTARFYVTDAYNLVQVTNQQARVIGKLSRLNSSRYPYMIHDNSTQLLVDARGNILTTTGKPVGRLTAA